MTGKRILVTRPAAQAGPLCELISERGGIAVEYPLFEIHRIEPDSHLLDIMSRLKTYTSLVFVSRNAVEYGLALFHDRIEPWQQIFAVGKSTARALQDAGLENVCYPTRGADSETLLQMPELSSERVGGSRLLIVRGVGGREVLAQTLRDRGAEVGYAEVYERRQPCYDQSHEHELWREKTADIVILTSNEAVDNLLARVPAAYHERLRDMQTVVMSKRIADYLGERGFHRTPAIVQQPDDEGIVMMCEIISGIQTP